MRSLNVYIEKSIRYTNGKKCSIYSRRRMSEDKVKQACNRHLCPENVQNLTVPRTNTEVWEAMNKGQQIVDGSVQRIQTSLSHALSAIIEMIEAIGSGTAGPTEDHLLGLTDANRLITNSFTSLTQVRKEMYRNALGFPIGKLCTWETPVGKELVFPDLGKKLKDKDETQVKLRKRNKFR